MPRPRGIRRCAMAPRRRHVASCCRRSVGNRLSPPLPKSLAGRIRLLLDIVSVRRNGYGDKHDPVLTHSLVSTGCNARSTNFVGYCFWSLGLSRRDRASRCFGHVTDCASCRSDGASRSLIREWKAKIVRRPRADRNAERHRHAAQPRDRQCDRIAGQERAVGGSRSRPRNLPTE